MSWEQVRFVVLGALLMAVTASVLGLVGTAVGGPTLDVTLSVVGRTVLTLLGLAAVALACARRAPWTSPLGAVMALSVMATGGYLADVWTWTAGAPAGGALFGVALSGSSAVGVALDLAVWVLVVAAVTFAVRGLGTRPGVTEGRDRI